MNHQVQSLRASGTLILTDIPRRGRRTSHSAPATGKRLEWRPDPKDRCDLPREYKILLDVYTDAQGIRRFYPIGSRLSFARKASVGGLIVLRDHLCLSKYEVLNYHLFRLLHRMVPQFREYLFREFKSKADLYLPRSGRQETSHCLPEGCGDITMADSRGWDPRNLIEVGRRVLAELERPTTNTATAISAGLWQAALQVGVDLTLLSEDDIAKQIHFGLFDSEVESKAVDPDKREIIQEHFLKLLKLHLNDSDGEFDHWCFNRLDKIYDAISKARRPGGKIPREIVRRVLLDLVWDSFRAVGDCIHAQMCVIRDLIPQPLNETELAIFRAQYLQSPCLANLPLILLKLPLSIFGEGLFAYLKNPNDPRIQGALLHLFYFHGEMARKKREGERNRKRVKSEGESDRRTRSVLNSTNFRDREGTREIACGDSTEGVNAHRTEIASFLCEMRKISCIHCKKLFRGEVEGIAAFATPVKGNEVTFIATCSRCFGCNDLRFGENEIRDAKQEIDKQRSRKSRDGQSDNQDSSTGLSSERAS